LIELEHPEKREKIRENPMNYGEWSKSIELDRTVTPKFFGTADSAQWKKKIFEQKKHLKRFYSRASRPQNH
jgi:hypothetical protein